MQVVIKMMANNIWTIEETERLISLVEVRPCLYDKTKLTNDQAWSEISDNLQKDGIKKTALCESELQFSFFIY